MAARQHRRRAAGAGLGERVADRLIADAVKAGVPAKEIDDDAGSVLELVFAAIEGRREGG